MTKKLNWVRIFRFANITEEQFEEMDLERKELLRIYDDFCLIQRDLESLALFFVSKFLTFAKVHSVRYRIKDPEHLIAKIIRKKIDNVERLINVTNYKKEITDLIGIRVLHLFKDDYYTVDQHIRDNFQISQNHIPIIYKRIGDTINKNKQFDNFEIKDHPRSYRSIHYILESTPATTTYYIEVQVRTIFEEGWSEIDHKLLYPDNLNNALLNEFSMILNSLSGSADSMATQMKKLKMEFENITEEHELEIKQRDEKIKSLETLINKSNLQAAEKTEIIDAIEAKDNFFYKNTLKELLNLSFENSELYKSYNIMDKTLRDIKRFNNKGSVTNEDGDLKG